MTKNLSERRQVCFLLLGLLVTGSLGFEFFYGIPRPILVKDSASYIDFWAIRTGGYPGFLELLSYFGASLSLVVLFQTGIAHICSMYMALQICRATSLPEFGVVALVAVLAPSPIREFWSTIGSEALFVPLITLFTAELIRFVFTKGASALAVICITLVVATTTRPAGLPLFSALMVLLLWARHDLNRRHYITLAASVVFAVGIVILEGAYYKARHPDGQPRESLTGVMLFGRSALISLSDIGRERAERNLDARELRLFKAVDRDFAPIRQLLDNLDNDELLEHLTSSYQVFAEYRYLRLNGFQVPPAPGEAGRLDTAFLKNVGLSRILQAPSQYVRLSLINYRGLWSPWSMKTPDGVRRYHDLVRTYGELPFADQIPVVEDRGWKLLYYGRHIFQIFGSITFCLAFFTVLASFLSKPRDNTLFAVGLLAFSVHIYMIVIAFAGIGILRYTLALWPIFVSLVVLSTCWLGVYVTRIRGHDTKVF